MRADPMVEGTPRTIPAPLRRRFPARPSRVDMRGAIERCVERRRSAAGDRVVVFVPERLQVSADPDALDEVLCALLSNALKFAPPRSPIHVTAISDESQVVITVRDAGPGLSHEQRSRILGRSNGHRGERGLEKVCRYVALHGAGCGWSGPRRVGRRSRSRSLGPSSSLGRVPSEPPRRNARRIPSFLKRGLKLLPPTGGSSASPRSSRDGTAVPSRPRDPRADRRIPCRGPASVPPGSWSPGDGRARGRCRRHPAGPGPAP
jgi:hypothetical protein